MRPTKQRSTTGDNPTPYREILLPTEWPQSLPNEEENFFISVLCSVSSIVWVVHGGAEKKYSPLYMWRTPQIDENDLKKSEPLAVLCRYLTKEGQDIIFGDDLGNGNEKTAALNQSKLRKFPPLSIYVLSMHQTQAELVSFLFSYVPSRVYQMSHDDFFPEAGGKGSLTISQVAALRGVESMIGFPALVVDSGCFLTYTAADADGAIIGGGMALGVEGRVEMVARRTQCTDGLTDLDAQTLLFKMTNMVSAKKKLDPFGNDVEEAVLAELLQGIIFPYREVIKDYLHRTNMGAKASGSNPEDIPTVVVTGGTSSVMQKLLEPTHGGLVQPDLTIPPYKVESMKHAIAYGLAFILRQKASAQKRKPQRLFDSLVIGRRVAKKSGIANGVTLRGTVTVPIYSAGDVDTPVYIIRYDDNQTENFTITEVHDGLKLYCSVGEENIPARPDEALKRMLTEKLENAAHAVSRLDTKNSSSKRQATAAPKVSPPKKSRKEKEPTSYIGTRVAKLFDEDGLYFGEITGYEDDEDGNGFWKILYDDNDEEEFDKNDLIKAVELYKKESSLDKRG